MKYYAFDSNINERDKNISYVRFLHAAPNINSIVLYINNVRMPSILAYCEFTEYHKALAGIYNIKAYSEDNTNKMSLLCDKDIKLEPKMIYTIALSANNKNLEFNIISDIKREINLNKVSMRYINLSNGIFNLDITMNGIIQVSDIGYRDVSKYIDLSAGTYLLNAYITNSRDKVLTVPNINLKSGKFYSAYIIGNKDKNPKLQVLLPLEGVSYLKF